MTITATTTQSGFFRRYPMAIPSAGVLFHDDQHRVMLVKPTGRAEWEIPGGVVEVRAGEVPITTGRREVSEELGLDLLLGRLLAVDTVPQGQDHAPMMAFVFDGGVLSAEQHAAIRFVDGEIERYDYVDPEHLDGLVVPRLARRITASARHARTGELTPVYLEHGYNLAATTP